MAFPVDLDQCYLIETFGTTAGRAIPHTGDDWARKKVNGKVVAEAPDIRAVFAGTVVFAGWHGVAGNRVIIRYWFGLHGDYGHMRSIAVKVGQTVKESEKIGELGGTGVKANGQPSVTGPHLHYTQSTDLDRLLKGVYPYWKDPKTGRVLWSSVDAWAKASGLQRPNYAIGSDGGKTSKKIENGFLMALTDEEQRRLLALAEAIRGDQVADVGGQQQSRAEMTLQQVNKLVGMFGVIDEIAAVVRDSASDADALAQALIEKGDRGYSALDRIRSVLNDLEPLAKKL